MRLPTPRLADATVGLAAICTIIAAGPLPLAAQGITIYAEAYEQEWTGAGSGIPLYLALHSGMPEAGRAEALDLIIDGLDLQYIQDYPEFRVAEEPDYYERRAEYFQGALARNPDLEVVLVGSLYPPDLRHDTLAMYNGQLSERRRLDTRRDDIYGAVAEWYLEMMTFYAERGVEIDIINLVNEPFQVSRRFGVSVDPMPEFFTARLFDAAVDSLRAYVADPARNPQGVEMPRIMGPSDIGPAGSVRLIQYYQREAPEAYDNIDVVSFHQYTGGTSTAISTLDRITGDKPLHQSEMHTNRGDGISSIDALDKSHRGVLSLAATFTSALNQGTNAWYYFLNVFPDDDSNPGLLQVKSGFERPVPFRQYYAFRQLVASQPIGARRLDRELANIRGDGDVLVMREEGSDTITVHFANYTSAAREVEISVLTDEGGAIVPIEAYDARVTDATANDSALARVAVDSIFSPFTVDAPPYSLNTYKLTVANSTGLSPKLAPGGTLTVRRAGGELVVRGAPVVSLAPIHLVAPDGRILARGDGPEVRFAIGHLPAGIYFVTAHTPLGQATERVAVW